MLLLILIFFLNTQVQIDIEGVKVDIGSLEFKYNEDPKTFYLTFDPIFANGFEEVVPMR